MANAEVVRFTLELSVEEAQILRSLIYFNVGGVGPRRNALAAIGGALHDVGVRAYNADEWPTEVIWIND